MLFRSMGMTGLQLLWQVQLPIALPVILSGIRIAMVTAIGIATIGVLIGSGGLGVLIWRGIQIPDPAMILSGAIPAALLAIVSEFGFGYLEKVTTPRGLKLKMEAGT